MKAFHRPPPIRQQGITLVVVLMILLVVTVLGIGAAQVSLTGERSARADRDYQIALQSAEAALIDAEFDIRGPNTFVANRMAIFESSTEGSEGASALGFPDLGCNDGSGNPLFRGLCQPSLTDQPVWLEAGLDTNVGRVAGNTVEFGTFTGRNFGAGAVGVQPSKPPRYIIERRILAQVGGAAELTGKKIAGYQITAIGFGPRPEIQAVLQTVFRRD